MTRNLVLPQSAVLAVAAGRQRLHLVAAPNAEREPFTAGQRLTVRPRRWQLGRDEPMPTSTRAVVAGVDLTTLGALTADDAPALGLGSRAGVADLARWWVAAHDAEWITDRPHAHALVIEQRWRTRWGTEPVWRVRLELDGEHRPRLLAVDSGLGYVASSARALPGAGEAVSEDEQAAITASAQPGIAAATARHAAERDRRDAIRAENRAARGQRARATRLAKRETAV